MATMTPSKILCKVHYGNNGSIFNPEPRIKIYVKSDLMRAKNLSFLILDFYIIIKKNVNDNF